MEEGIRSDEKVTQDMDNLEIKICKVKQPPGLAVVEVLGWTEVHQVLMIGEDLDRERGPVEVVYPGFQSTDDSKEFLVVDVIVPLSRDE